MKPDALKEFLDQKYQQYNQPDFIENDPICIPHLFSNQQDIEIMGFWAAVLAWGQRKTIISKCKELINRMDGEPHRFIMNHTEADLKSIIGFKHRTFNDTDALYFIAFFKKYYSQNYTLENAFLVPKEAQNIESGLINFHNQFFDDDFTPSRTRKHIATPIRKSACKRINMYLRWMVRNDNHGVDFGIWQKIKPSQLVCPCDVHVDNVGRLLGLIKRPKTDWQTAVELTESLKILDPSDPVKYDFALFGLGIEKYF